MADWYGNARTNYVRIKPEHESAMLVVCDIFSILAIVKMHEGLRHFGFFPANTNSNGDFARRRNVSDLADPKKLNGLNIVVDDNGDFELDWLLIAGYMEDDDILVIETIGNEKLRYLTGVSEAYSTTAMLGSISIGDIYAQFGVKTQAVY